MSILKYLKNPLRVIYLFGIKGKIRFLDDETYLKIMYKAAFGKRLDLDNPTSFNEKIQWMKINDRNPDYPIMVDKCEAKKYVANIIGANYIIPTIGVWDKVEDIAFDKLPSKFVLKCTHDSGGVVICSNKSQLDLKKAKRKLENALNSSYYWVGREWPYKNVRPRILAEEYLEDSTGTGIKDYKIFCFNGKPEIILVCSNRFGVGGLAEDFFDLEWNHLNMSRLNHSNSTIIVEKPEKLNEMIEKSELLAGNKRFSRIDFYEVGGQIFFGEITLYPASGFDGFVPEEWDYKLGQKIRL